ncbi:MAG: helix-turn-helix domain-containing protein [Thiohalomonadales bacterium]
MFNEFMNRDDYFFIHNHVTDIEQVPDIMPDVHARILQYSPGQLSGESVCLELPEILVYRNSAQRGLQIELAPQTDWFGVMIPDYVSDSFNWMGQAFETDTILLLPPSEVAQYSLPLSWSSIEFFIETPLLKKLGLLSIDGTPNYNTKIYQTTVSKKIRNALLNKGRQLLKMAELDHPDLHDPFFQVQHKEQLVELLQRVLPPSGNDITMNFNTSSSHKLISRAQELIEQFIQSGQPLSIPDLANRLDVHERKLYNVFQKTLGISPYAWGHIVRMHQFRQQAIESSEKHGAITKIASELGFNNMSHFSEQFKRLFHETPRQFLSRSISPS